MQTRRSCSATKEGSSELFQNHDIDKALECGDPHFKSGYHRHYEITVLLYTENINNAAVCI